MEHGSKKKNRNTWARMSECFVRGGDPLTSSRTTRSSPVTQLALKQRGLRRCRGNPSVTVAENSFCRAFKIFIVPLIFAVIGTDRIYRIISPLPPPFLALVIARARRGGGSREREQRIVSHTSRSLSLSLSLFLFSTTRLRIGCLSERCFIHAHRASKVLPESAFKYTANRLSLKP